MIAKSSGYSGSTPASSTKTNKMENSVNTEKEEFEKAARPLIEYLKSNQHPHVTVIVDSEHAELLEGKLNYSTQG